jgi:transketolase
MREQQEMRAIYCATMMEMAERDERIVAVQADLMGGHGMRPFAEKFPDRSFNVGVAEANMAGIAAGLAAAGKIPFIHSFATFATRRCFDQIAISICYARLKVCIIGSDPGVGAELNGGTHMALEDVAIMRTLPGMTVFEPVDGAQLKSALPALVALEGPIYIRLYRKAAESVFNEDYRFRPDKADVLKDGKDVAIIASGVCVHEALVAAEKLATDGIRARVLNIHTIKPMDTDAVIRAASETGAVVTVENHGIIGGLGSAVAETLAEGYPAPLIRLGARDRFGEVGKQDYLMRTFGITADCIVDAARNILKCKRRV